MSKNDGSIMSETCDITVALAGNPNVGKSTLFNMLTGETAHVGNWPGVTVELEQGIRKYGGKRICFIDLPGTYGIGATSLEEIVAREFIVSGNPDVVAVLVDSTTPERTIYLAIQIMELTPNVIIVFTKTDEAHSKGIHIHYDKLEEYLGVPVVPVAAIKGEGIRDLLETVVNFEKRAKRKKPLKISYGGLEYFISELVQIIRSSKALSPYPSRWAAVRLLEGDERLRTIIEEAGENEVLRKIDKLIDVARRTLGRDLTELIIRLRFEYVDSLVKKVVIRTEVAEEVGIDIFQRPVIGSLLSLGLLFFVFLAVFAINTGFPLNLIAEIMGMPDLAARIEEFSISGLMSEAFGALSDIAAGTLQQFLPHWAVSLISDGIITGLGAVLSFFPLILMVFLFLAILEDSGLTPRMAVAFHNALSKFGLSGRAIYPFVISLGCNVPGVMASRSSLDEQERIEIIFSSPFIPCQARLIVAIAFAVALFDSPLMQAATIATVYAAGITVALLTSLIIRKYYFGIKERPELIIELPPLHRPKLKVVWWLTWDNTKHFLKKAGVIIFALSIIVWVLLYTGPTGYLPDTYGSDFFGHSYAAIMGRWIAPALTPLGLTDEQGWKVGFALINGLVAKEVIIDSITVLYGQDADPSEAIRALTLSPAQGIALLLFMMLYVPCIATLAVMYQEIKSLKLTLGGLIYMIAVAYIVALVAYALLSLLA